MVDLRLLEYLESFLTDERKQRFVDVLAHRTNHFTIALEDVYQLHNTSAVMRSCEVFGIQNLHVIEEKFGKQIDKEIAMGSEKWVDINRFATMESCVESLRQNGYQIVATTPHFESADIDQFDISKRSAIFFGTERNGLGEEFLSKADAFIRIPMFGFTESLNISVAAALIIQNLTSRLRKSNIDWHLTEEQILQKRLDWARKSIKDIARIEERFNQLMR